MRASGSSSASAVGSVPPPKPAISTRDGAGCNSSDAVIMRVYVNTIRFG